MIRCFVAMSFGRQDTDQIFSKVIRPVLRREGMTVIRVDRKEHNRNINDVIMEELRKADIVVADLTYARPSVYFEAGFAEASIPVIYTARTDHFRAKSTDEHGNYHVHFDVSMRNIIGWKDLQDSTFAERLTRRINHVARPLRASQAESRKITGAEAVYQALPAASRMEKLAHIAEQELQSAGYILKTEHIFNVLAAVFLTPKGKDSSAAAARAIKEGKPPRDAWGTAIHGIDEDNNSIRSATVLVSPRLIVQYLRMAPQMVMGEERQSVVDFERERSRKHGNTPRPRTHTIILASEGLVKLESVRHQLPEAQLAGGALSWVVKKAAEPILRRPASIDHFRIVLVDRLRSSEEFRSRLVAALPSNSALQGTRAKRRTPKRKR